MKVVYVEGKTEELIPAENSEDYEGYEVWDTLEISDEEFDRYELLRIELYDLVQEITARARGEN